MAKRKLAEFLQYPDKRQTLGRKPSRKSALGYAELPRNLAGLGFAVRQERHNCVLDPQGKRISA